jgi:hypothetical protein
MPAIARPSVPSLPHSTRPNPCFPGIARCADLSVSRITPSLCHSTHRLPVITVFLVTSLNDSVNFEVLEPAKTGNCPGYQRIDGALS